MILKLKEKFDHFLEFWVSHLHSNIEVHKLVEELSSTYEIGIITNMYPNLFDIILEKNIVPDIKYSFVIKSCDIGYCKPDKEIYEYALEQVQRKGDILFTDDGLLNLEIPKEMGWKTVHFKKNDISQSVKEINRILL